MTIPTLHGITTRTISTPRLRMRVLFSGPDEGTPVLFVHGNASSATFWEETMLALPSGYRGVAPDLRGYGDTEDKRVDAIRGFGDWVDDLLELKRALGVTSYHAIGHSLGGALLFSLVVEDGESILSVTLVNPGSPFGFGGSKDVHGTPTFDDFAGSGGGTVNPDFARLLGEGDRSSDHPASPRNVMNSFYWKPPFRPEREEALLSSLLSEKVGPEKYPGDSVTSPNWPGVAPGRYGPVNALSPKYVGDTVERFLAVPEKPPVLWVRGSDDQIVSDNSLFDFGTLGQLGAVPGWPGAETFPPQPMVAQTRFVLEKYQAQGGAYREAVIENTGHTPFIEKPLVFTEHLMSHLKAASLEL